MKSFERVRLQALALEVVAIARRTGAIPRGPIPLPTRIEKFTVNRSPHVDKKSREQFEMRTHKRVIYIDDPTPRTIEMMYRVELPAEVDVEVTEEVDGYWISAGERQTFAVASF